MVAGASSATKIPGKAALEDKTCEELRKLCDKHGLATGGVKDKLVSRLVKARRNTSSKDVKKSAEKPASEAAGDEKPKLRPPSALASEPNAEQWRTWKREYSFWKRTMFGWHSEFAMLQCLLTALPDSAKKVVFTQLDMEAMTLETLIDVLQMEYGEDEFLEQRDALKEYRSCKRASSEGLGDFLKRFRHVRQAAILAGVLVANAATDTWDLLDSCSLSSTQRSNITSQMQALALVQPNVSEYDHCQKLLLNLARAFGSEKPQDTALFSAEEGHGKGGEPGGGHWKAAKTWKVQGNGKKGKGKGKGKDSWKGENKGKGFGKGKDTGKGSGKGKKVDWLCPKCKARCWGSKDACFKCGEKKPADAQPAVAVK